MSERKAKEVRRNGNGEKPKIQVTISVYGNGRVEVSGFPLSHNLCMDIMHAGLRRAESFFLQAAKDGNLDEQNNYQPPKIIQPHPVIMRPQ